MQSHSIIAVVTRETRLQGLKARWATASNAAFRMKQAVEHERSRRRAQAKTTSANATSAESLAAVDAFADHDEYLEEDAAYQSNLSVLQRDLELGYPVVNIDRTLLATFDFGRCIAVVVVGQDGLVANAAKYVGDLPIIGVNPDPQRIDGVLLPFAIHEARRIVQQVVRGQARTRQVTLAQAELNDGQKLLAFNDLFIGCRSHASARYTLEADGRFEEQSSSGVLVSTGAGSTGWLSSVYNMVDGVLRTQGREPIPRPALAWEDRRLAWVVREPFLSKQSQAGLVAGLLPESEELVIGSQLPTGGVIFSDGVEADFLEFNSGTIARVFAASQRAHLVVR
ncbi:NAD(+)/NADH kinase [Lignipirellula cremea]|uniref:NAD(+)/NADH kinase family protein n=1 Tax=Lignipirellula cremea TaxID=2528010 RepID=A0A518DU74_9BACT|nr:hypothetical protein [Lignipirellula cremea]QDU95387.1 NAD(+)/NADH kinase family protein [Lignipirellula cremea]